MPPPHFLRAAAHPGQAGLRIYFKQDRGKVVNNLVVNILFVYKYNVYKKYQCYMLEERYGSFSRVLPHISRRGGGVHEFRLWLANKSGTTKAAKIYFDEEY